LSNSASVNGAPFATLALAALLLAFAAVAGFVAVFTVISFFPGLKHYCLILPNFYGPFINIHQYGLWRRIVPESC
jgi:hypothetical protein